MQLKRLEIKGFKSFADKVVINFDEGITGIVGPNGCGKSNVVDAIRWVLGEQKTKALRSDKMENVIFNGTKKRKQTQLAEVSLTFDNTKNLIPIEYTQVTITRRYYRSGESEYQLNGVTCRLKDIRDLFLDTGIASSSYAIIELKMVDDLLNDKDNSRRALFEEAAGISKFKLRKKETLKKLKDTDEDLSRVEDLLFEIEKNLKSLERQARQAKRYFDIKEQYKVSSMALAKKTVSSSQDTFDKITKELNLQQDQKQGQNTLLLDKEAQLEKIKLELLNKEKLLASRQKTLNEQVNNIRQYESEKKIKNERQRFLQDKIEKLREQISMDKQSNERAAFSIQSLEKDKELADKEFMLSKETLTTLKEAYEQQQIATQQAQNELNELNQQYLSKREWVFQQGKKLEIKQIQLGTLKQELDKTSETSTQQSADLQQFDNKISEFQEEKTIKQQQFEELRASQEALINNQTQYKKKIELLTKELALANRTLDSRQNEFNLTKSLVENLEGFPDAIKFLKKKTNWKDAPLLSDIITCDADYRICIENFLEPFMNYYIVENKSDAILAVNLLSESSRGKANFFILNQLKDYKSSVSNVFSSGTPATEIVEYDEKYGKLFEYLLSQVYIYEGETPLAEDNVILIDKSGKVISRPFSISGGSVGLFEGKRIGRAKNLEKLSEDIKALQKKQSQLQSSISSVENDINQLTVKDRSLELDTVREEINSINQSLAALLSKQEQFSSMLTSNATRREDILEQITLLNDAIDELQPISETGQDQINALENQVHEKRELTQELTDALSTKSLAFNEANVLFHQKENRVESILQEIKFKQESFENSSERVQNNTEGLQEATNDLNELVKKTNQNDVDLVSMYEEKELLEKGVNEAEKDYYQCRGEIDQNEKLIKEVQRQRELIDQVIMEWQNKLNDTKITLTSVKERLSVEFNIDFNQIDEDLIAPLAEQTVEYLQQNVEKLKRSMENIGPINPMAMEAFDEIKERFDFITEQKADLLNAKESLLTTIAEIDEVAKETFITAFNEIKANFIKVFRTLFTDEDDCDLYLTDPENPLESPIDIIAKPKGKRPLTINQLSGGEKTLTATSLLFAIYLIKPAPFCIFDEVDAPLDDANIDKFNNIIREFSKDSQFIIVTHNKRTMASTDVIYGITMIEQGISRVVPVDLRELA
ncbi:MAG: chromosome segregation protein [Cyclobacteriaceae bacterium]|jgi:chromosome segregation protein